MKQTFCFLLFSLFFISLSAQTKDTIFVSTTTENGTMTPGVMVEARHRIFRLEEPVRTMFKWNLIGLTPITVGRKLFTTTNRSIIEDSWPLQLQLGVERKLSNSVSLNVMVSTTLRANEKWFTDYEITLEPRWYYSMNRRIREGKQANNVSGNYISLAFNRLEHLSQINYTAYGASLNWGMQRRLFDRGYFDLGFGAGVNRELQTKFSRGATAFSSQPRVQIGFGGVLPKNRKSPGGYCEALNCFREERSMLKIDLFNLLNYQLEHYWSHVDVQPSIAFEQKTGSAPFSVQVELKGRYNQFDQRNLDPTTSVGGPYHYKGYSTEISLEPRWHYRLNRNIAAGRSGNNLSGPYLGARGYLLYGQGQINGGIQNTITKIAGIAPVLGIQYRFLGNGFVDFNVACGPEIKNNKTTVKGDNSTEVREKAWNPTANFRVGLAF